MSSAGQKEREPADYYPTPSWCVDRLLDRLGGELFPALGHNRHLPMSDSTRVLEPCVGGGAIVDAIDAWAAQLYPTITGGLAKRPAPTWTTVDIRDTERADHVGDYLSGISGQVELEPFAELERWISGPAIGTWTFDLVVTNPPYSRAFDFVRRSLELAPLVVMLLRVGWLGSEEREAWLRVNTPSVYLLPNRPSFSADGKTDSDYYAWMVWRRDGSQAVFEVLMGTPLDQRRRKRDRPLPGQLELGDG